MSSENQENEVEKNIILWKTEHENILHRPKRKMRQKHIKK